MLRPADYRKNESATTRMVPDISRAQKQLNYDPVVSFEEGLSRTVDWLTKNIVSYSGRPMAVVD